MQFVLLRPVLMLIAVTLCAAAARAEDWSQWRGPARDGHLVGFKSPSVWPKQLAKKWSIQVGEGHSSPLIVGNRAYVFVRKGEQEHTLCLDMGNGKTLWTDKVDAPFDSVIFPARSLGKSPRSTPLFKDGKLYTIGVNGLMSCLNAANGKVIWRKDFSKMFTLPMPICGASLSPLIDGQKIYVHAGHDAQGAFMALDKDTGKELWAWRGEGPGYTSPIVATIGGMRQIITASHNMWIGLDPANGALLWSIGVRQSMFNHNSITPIVVGNTVICGGNQRTTFALKITRNGDRWKADKVWETRDVTMSTGSPILSGNRIYAFNEKKRGQVVAMSLENGKILWGCQGSKGEHATLYETDAHLLTFTIGGELIVYKKAGETLNEVAKYDVADSAMWSSPAVSGNRLLVKGAETLTLWEVPAP